jgi:hypothetical protein
LTTNAECADFRSSVDRMYGERDEFFFHFTTAEAGFEFILPGGL